MVRLTGPHGRRGSGAIGCLLSLVIFAAALYYGVNVGEAYWRFYQIRDEIRSQARLAPGLTDEVIRRRLVARADELNLPRDARRFKIRRTEGSIIIETKYDEYLDLLFLKRQIVFHPRAVERI